MDYEYKSIKVKVDTYERLNHNARLRMTKKNSIPRTFDEIITALLDAAKVPK